MERPYDASACLTNPPITRISVPALDFSVVVNTHMGLERWTMIIVQSGYVPEYHRVH